MSFRPDAQLDPEQVRDVRGRRGAGLAVGGGGIGVVLVALAIMLLGGDPSVLLGGGGSSPALQPAAEGTSAIESCRTGADANNRADCRVVGYVNSIQAYWTDEFQRSGSRYPRAETVLFSGSTQSACGTASSATGPFYCPPDRAVYLDLSFFQELQGRFGAQGGNFAEAYVVAHEYGHHVQNLTGALDNRGRDTGASSSAVRVELMADCLAGVWAHHAESTGFLRKLTREDIAQALDAAAAVGDDRIQRSTQGRVNPESWTHGSAEQRQRWFLVGWERGTFDDCNTFAAANP